MADRQFVVGIFKEEGPVVKALEGLKWYNGSLHHVYGPYPSHSIHRSADDLLGRKKSKVGSFTLVGGILGFLLGFGLSIYTASQWQLIVSGKPIVALVPFFIVGFECTILFGILGNVLGLLTQARLPRFKMPEYYNPLFTGDHFGVVASCETADMQGLMAFFRETGGEAKPV
ncbi:MAG: DUF3341 domain-containing protein [Desulfobacterales bacterium]